MSALNRQLVQCCFNGSRKKLYTYHFDGDPPLKVGETVRVESRDGNGWVRIEVVAVDVVAPMTLGTKPVFRPEEPNPTLNFDGEK